MNEYQIKFYFADSTNIEIYLDSKLEIKDFITDFGNKIHNQKFITIINNNNGSVIINIDNVKCYTIELVQKDITEGGSD